MEEMILYVTEVERVRVEEFVNVLRTPCEIYRGTNQSLVTERFEEEFRSKLLIHHGFIGSPLVEESFESAFISSCEYAGYIVEKAPDGTRFWDVCVDGRKISLKSTKAAKLKENILHISKLTEASWIQDCRAAKTRQEKTLELFSQYIDQVDSIIQLRYFKNTNKYEMVEIPVALFKQIADVDRNYFNADGPTINIPIDKIPQDFTLKLDRSDAKITIANINKNVCNVLGVWSL